MDRLMLTNGVLESPCGLGESLNPTGGSGLSRRQAMAILVAAMSLTGLASCTSEDQQDPPAAALDDAAAGLSASVTQNRRDALALRVQIKVRQDDGPALHLSGASAVVPGFAGESRRELDTRTRPGGALDLPVELGEVQCEQSQPRGSVMVTLTVSGLGEPVALQAPDPHGVIARLHRTECDVRAVTTVVPLAWSDEWRQEGTGTDAVSAGSLRLGPIADDHSATLVGVDGTVLFGPQVTQGPGSQELPVVVGPGEVLDLPITMSAARCDLHAVAEAFPHRAYAFRIRVGVDGREAVAVTVQPPEVARSVMLGALLDQCELR